MKVSIGNGNQGRRAPHISAMWVLSEIAISMALTTMLEERFFDILMATM